MSIKSALFNMINIAKTYKKDSGGNHWYLMSRGHSLRNLLKGREFFDMSCNEDRALAFKICTPLSSALTKIGSMFSRGELYVVDKDNNEANKYNNVRELLQNPNILENQTVFLKNIEMTLKLYGFCPIYMLKATKNSIPSQMIVIPPYLFHTRCTGKLFNQLDRKDVVERAYINWHGEQIDLEEDEYFVIYNSSVSVDRSHGLTYSSQVDALSFPVTLWIHQMIASNTLIVDGGPKGIIYNDDSSEYANAALTSEEQKNLNSKFKSEYGLVNKAFSILVTKAKVGWLPLNYDSGQLKLHEEDVRCSNKICNAFELNPALFDSAAKYENQESAERKAYTSVIIPDSKIICEALTRILINDGGHIYLDYSDVECLQSNKKDEAATLVAMKNSLIGFYEAGVMSMEEVRKELSNYIDINPDDRNGTFKEQI